MLECSINKSLEILACISDKPDTHERLKKALIILQQVSDLFKTPRKDFNDHEIIKIERLCQMWGGHMPNLFPQMTVTPEVPSPTRTVISSKLMVVR